MFDSEKKFMDFKKMINGAPQNIMKQLKVEIASSAN